MVKIGGLQLSKPIFNWEAHDKLTELEQFKADCKILFDGPLSDIKDMQQAGLIVNWLGRETTQILASVDTEINNVDVVYETLEKILLPESNQDSCLIYNAKRDNCSVHQSYI